MDTDENIQQPSAIAVDQQTGDVYWADSGRELSEGPVVRYRPSTGETEDPFVRSQFIHGLAVLGSTLYWTDGEGSVKSSRGAESEILVDHVLGVQGIAAVNISFHGECPMCMFSETCGAVGRGERARGRGRGGEGRGGEGE